LEREFLNDFQALKNFIVLEIPVFLKMVSKLAMGSKRIDL